ncbi:MAG: hypothetical protein K2N63_06770, partial [Lachnospiraceae bacterium]|nr:hypothetical protein [Lachnospiraceae bacterium]
IFQQSIHNFSIFVNFAEFAGGNRHRDMSLEDSSAAHIRIDLLESINLDANCISEIAVNYRNGPDEKIDIAKLKDSTTILKVFFPIQGTQLGTEYILNNMDEILRNERQKYYSQVEEHFSNATEIGEDYDINKIWKETPVV